MNCPSCGNELKERIRDYEYVESGLRNVILKNIRVHECKKCGELLPEITNVKQVHNWIAEYLVDKQGPLTGEEFRFLRKTMGKSAKEMSEQLTVDPVTISRWENNRVIIGPQSDRLIRMTFILGKGDKYSTEIRHAAAKKLLEHARAILLHGIHQSNRKPKPERIVINPQREVTAHD